MRATPELRQAFARQLAAHAVAHYRLAGADPRLEAAFAMVPREDFAGPPPWSLLVVDGGAARRVEGVGLEDLYQDVLVALDPDRGINIGEPGLHFAWLTHLAPQPGERVLQIGAGSGYYSAIFAALGCRVTAWEIVPELAARAEANLAPYPAARVIAGDATAAPAPVDPAEIVYVCAGLAAPPRAWLEAIAPGGRMIFPWRPSDDAALALLLRRAPGGFSVEPLMPAWFIPCAGLARGRASLDQESAAAVRALHLTRDHPPDASAVYTTPDLWFSTRPLAKP